MFSDNQMMLRRLICGTSEFQKIPDKIDDEDIKIFYKNLCRLGGNAICSELIRMANGEIEPSDAQISEWSKAFNWYNGRWHS